MNVKPVCSTHYHPSHFEPSHSPTMQPHVSTASLNFGTVPLSTVEDVTNTHLVLDRKTPIHSAPGARLAVTVGHGQCQTVAVGAAQQQPVAVPRYQYYGCSKPAELEDKHSTLQDALD
eukprot:scaffold84075_cov76-Phaeocystis_antarctica.AAC.1